MEVFEKYSSDASRFLMLDGSLIHYRDEGKGEVIVLIHGAFSSLHTFDRWTEILQESYRVIRFDAPGFGLSSPLKDPSSVSIDHFVKLIDRFVNRLGIKKFHLIGSSLGGWLAWEYCLQHPKKVRRLALIGSAGFMDHRNVPLPIKMMRTPFVDKIVKHAVRRSVMEVFVKEVYGNEEMITSELLDRYYDLFTRPGNPEAFFNLVNAKFTDRTRRLRSIKHATLIMWGALDNWMPLENAYKFRDRIPNAELLIYEDLGHLPFEEAPEATAEDLQHFLNEEIAIGTRATKA
ncbi:alpha/beta hydrolase [Chitinophagales bacterium]|nr:alpha/beta hydrolase [Chitinophagales bacterium]